MKLKILLPLLLISNFLFSQSRLYFDGYGDYVALNGTDFPAPWTMECWVSKNALASWQHLLTSTDNTSGFRIEQYINNAKIGITKAGIADWQFSYSLPVGQWTHLAITNDGTTMKLYVNGTQTGGNITGSIPFPMGMIGLNTTGGGALNARIDELRIWNTVLAQTEIATWMNTAVDNTHPNFANLLHYYRLDEGTGNIAHDQAGTLDGTIYGATWEQVFQYDEAAVALLDPPPFVTNFTNNQAVKVRLSNVGSANIGDDFTVSYSLDGGAPVSQVVTVTTPIAPNAITDLTFPNVDLTTADIHLFKIWLNMPGDQNPSNDTLYATTSKTQITLGNVTNVQSGNGEYIFSTGVTKLRVKFYRDDVFRVTLAPTGNFTDPLAGILAINPNPATDPVMNFQDEQDFYAIKTDKVTLTVSKSPLKLTCRDKDGNLLWQESSPLIFGQQTRQQLTQGSDEQFYGCGMQNGYFAHRNKVVKIQNDYQNWGDGAVPNPAPFFMSTRGYGMFRNTFAPGEYNFNSPVVLRHNETGFDCYYFAGDLKQVLEGYTWVTGRPFMLPRWGMEFGDADCYNDTGTTMDVFQTIAQKYRDNNMPGGWILPNDGYSCGYEALPAVVDSLETLGFYTGLWTESGTDNAAFEVGEAGTRLWKLDVALVGPGYQSAFNAGLAAFGGIESNSNARGYVWTVAGWAGTQRFATVWSGDQSGNWENIRFHIPTVIGSGLSGHNCATGDVDGIFGGSAATYVRDLQWKCLTPVMMTISGWAATGKQPWLYGTQNTATNRKYLMLKNRLKPYIYTYCREAHETGVPTVRGMMLEFPNDPKCLADSVKYQFMCGEWLLVAPVYTNSTVRNGIYLPEGQWVDYWDGTEYNGPQMLNGYSAPLSKLPLFVRTGAIIPMYPAMLHDRAQPFDTLTLDVYPKGQTSFTLYEDDGFSQDYKNGEFAKTQITSETIIDQLSAVDIPHSITVGPAVGDYDGKLSERVLVCEVRFPWQHYLNEVELNGVAMEEYYNKADWEAAAEGFYYEYGNKAYIKTLPRPCDQTTVFEFVSAAVATNEVLDDRQLTLRPNPAADAVTLVFEESVKVLTVEIVSVSGQMIRSVDANFFGKEFQLGLNGLASGAYYLKVLTGEGVISKKIIVK